MEIDARKEALAAFYRRYLQCCNDHRFEQIGEFVLQDVVVNGAPQGLADYVQGLAEVIAAFPDYHWDLRHLLVDGCWVSAHMIDTGTHLGSFLGVASTGRSVRMQEFAMYRVQGDKIVEVWVVGDNLELLRQLS